MNDRFLNRGKSKDNGEWVVGYYCPTAFTRFPCKPSIYPAETINHHWHAVEIIPETLGGCTGKNDKNGRMVFEGDIVRVKKFNDDPIIGKIVFNENTAGFEVWWNIVVGAYSEKATRKENFAVCGQMEVIGNIYDTPELLK